MQIHELGISLLPGLLQDLVRGRQFASCQVRADLCACSVHEVLPAAAPRAAAGMHP